MTLTDKLKKLLANNIVDCESHEDCITCPLSKHITITMPLGDVESLGKGGSWSGNMPFGKINFQVQPCMMLAEILKKLDLNEKKGDPDESLRVFTYKNEDIPAMKG